MSYDFKEFKKKLKETEEWLKRELSSIQTGRATPAVFDSIMVNSYGSKVHINQLASINTEDARTLRIVPWDTDSIQNIETAIRETDLGVGVSVDEQGLRATFPDLTGETRAKFIKLVHSKLEEARISIRNERDEVWETLQNQEKEGEISEDEKFSHKEQMEKITKEANDELIKIADRKEKDLSV